MILRYKNSIDKNLKIYMGILLNLCDRFIFY